MAQLSLTNKEEETLTKALEACHGVDRHPRPVRRTPATARLARAPHAGKGCRVLLRRFRFDDLPSAGIMNIRGKLVGRLRDQMRVDLERQKVASEQSLGSNRDGP